MADSEDLTSEQTEQLLQFQVKTSQHWSNIHCKHRFDTLAEYESGVSIANGLTAA